jgi:3'-phosphoadenosine 5'-phosphosulfate sulfotransferase (PAPS reductase)/FAD synthetase
MEIALMDEQTSSPYLATGPTLVSFSGGRTSAYMLHETIAAHGGTLPEHVIVAFANTGKEREETLRFVHECGSRWGVTVRWVEWRDGEAKFEEVGFNSASRNGEPFAALIAKRNYLPNVVTRFCSVELKIRTLAHLMKSLGHRHWQSMVGLRYDEGLRVLKALDRNARGEDPWEVSMPLSKARVTKRDVMAFWARQPFDLQLQPHEGNCDLCFLKGRNKLMRLMRDNPGMADWWIERERSVKANTPGGARFVAEHSYADLEGLVAASPELPLFEDDEEHDVECGLVCALEDA